jgi:hypothetical protein
MSRHIHHFSHNCADVCANTQTLLAYVPTSEEVEQLSNYSDDRAKLGKAEQFFISIMVSVFVRACAAMEPSCVHI